MINFLEGLCSCFNPEIKRNILDYLSSAKLNQQVIEEQKCSEQNQAPSQSIYAQVKTKSYYFMKLKQEEEIPQQSKSEEPAIEYDNSLEPNYYPAQSVQSMDLYDQIYVKKLAALQKILKEEMGPQYSKIYDSQDDVNLKIYCKQEILNTKRFNSYRFDFKIHHEHAKLTPNDYLALHLEGQQSNLHEPLLNSRSLVSITQGKMAINHRCYKKILVINQHDFYTAEKSQLVEENGQQVVYNIVFSVKGEFPKLADYSRGWVNLVGLKVSQHKAEEEQASTSLRQQQQGYLSVSGLINVELQISVNANMLKQPIAKQIRVYVQKLVCSLTKSDAI